MRLVQALSEVRVCQLKVSPSGNRAQVSACVHNKSKEAKRDQGIALRGLEQPVSVARPEAEPPTVLLEKRLKIPGELTPALGKGVRFGLELEGKTPQVFEAYADRFDLLQ